MKMHFTQAIFILLISSLTNPLLASQWALSFGVNDMIVKGARPLEAAPDGDTSHTLGAQIAIHGMSDKQSAIQQSGNFKILADKDTDHLDPDHVPVWFIGEYQAKAKLSSITQNSTLNMVVDADYKGNTVSSVERQMKLFAGINAQYNTAAFDTGITASTGRYALEIDDDVPKTRDYGREDLKNINYAYSIMADTRIALGEDFNVLFVAQTWQTGSQWLENQLTLQLDYNSNSWAKDSTFSVSVTHTEYNLDSYNHDDKTAPGYLPILAWNKDTLIQAYIKIPWEF